jgi:hypothetical protein
MRFLDALIDNRHRDESDQLVTTGDWKLRLIDHSLAFGESNQLSESYTGQAASAPAELLQRLRLLDEQAIRSLLSDLLTESQIEALLTRRAQLVG